MLGYFQTEENRLCSENGDIAVDDLKQCKDAAKDLKMSLIRSQSSSGYPKGCYWYGGSLFDYLGLYFNPHSTGSENKWARQICNPKGT